MCLCGVVGGPQIEDGPGVMVAEVEREAQTPKEGGGAPCRKYTGRDCELCSCRPQASTAPMEGAATNPIRSPSWTLNLTLNPELAKALKRGRNRQNRQTS